MKITTNGIGIKSLSINKSGLALYGNIAFETWAKDGMRLYKMTQTGPNPVFTFHLKGGPAPTPYNRGSDMRCWMRAWSHRQKRGTLQNFGATEPISVVLDADGKQLHVTMPPLDKCKAVLRPKGQWKAKVKAEEMDKQFEMALEKIAELEAEVAPCGHAETYADNDWLRCKECDHRLAPTTVPEPKTWTQEYLVTPTTPAKPTLDLLEAIDLINQHKDILGRALVFSVTPGGKLRAIVEYGG